MSNPAPDFDVEKRRRWYGFCLGSVSALTIIFVLLIKEPVSEDEEIWFVLLIWFLLTLFIGVAAYAIWYRPHSRKIRAAALSILAVFLGLLSIFGAIFLMDGFQYGFQNPVYFLRDIIGINVDLLGVPYFVAAVIGWIFARPEPDVRDEF